MEYVCDNCNRVYKREKNLTNHLEKRVCFVTEYRCEHCDKIFSHKNGLYRHTKYYCKAHKADALDGKIDDVNSKFDEIASENKKLSAQNAQLHENMARILELMENMQGNINIDTLNITNTVNNIQIKSYTASTLSELPEDEQILICKSGFNCVPVLLERTHLNPDTPEFHNLLITNLRDKYIYYYDGENWITGDKDVVIPKIYEHKSSEIEDFYKEYSIANKITPSQQRAFERWLRANESERDQNDSLRNMNGTLQKKIYDKRDVVKKTKKQYEDALDINYDGVEQLDGADRGEIMTVESTDNADSTGSVESAENVESTVNAELTVNAESDDPVKTVKAVKVKTDVKYARPTRAKAVKVDTTRGRSVKVGLTDKATAKATKVSKTVRDAKTARAIKNAKKR